MPQNSKIQANLIISLVEPKVNPVSFADGSVIWMNARKKPDPIFGPWFELANFPDKDFSTNSCLLVEKLASSGTNVNPLIARALLEETNRTLKAASIVYTRVFKGIDAEYKNLTKALTNDIKNIASAKLPEESHEELRQILVRGRAPPKCLVRRPNPSTAANCVKGAPRSETALRLLAGHMPARPDVLWLWWIVGTTQLSSLIAWQPQQPGEEVPRRFLEILSSTNRPTFTNGSGRLEMAQAIVSPQPTDCQGFCEPRLVASFW